MEDQCRPTFALPTNELCKVIHNVNTFACRMNFKIHSFKWDPVHSSKSALWGSIRLETDDGSRDCFVDVETNSFINLHKRCPHNKNAKVRLDAIIDSHSRKLVHIHEQRNG
jgi:hypothetical protein